ncbi:MAG: hypothetical protein ACOH5I_04925 [Oligoflexus sp.]
MKFLPQLSIHQLKSLDDPQFFPCDLLIIYAGHIPDTDLHQWIEGIKKRIQAQGKIWTPSLILSPVGYSDLSECLHEYADSNWYFDIIHPDHWSSLPIRVANLLRIHDHLHELYRYQDQLTSLQERISTVEQELVQLSTKGSSSK